MLPKALPTPGSAFFFAPLQIPSSVYTARLRGRTTWTRCRSRRPSPRSTTVGALRWPQTHLIHEGAAGSRSLSSSASCGVFCRGCLCIWSCWSQRSHCWSPRASFSNRLSSSRRTASHHDCESSNLWKIMTNPFDWPTQWYCDSADPCSSWRAERRGRCRLASSRWSRTGHEDVVLRKGHVGRLSGGGVFAAVKRRGCPLSLQSSQPPCAVGRAG